MWHPVTEWDTLPEQGGREFAVAGRIVALFRTGERIYAIDGICAHAGGPLGKGMLRGCIVTCPWHGWQFDVSTGQHCLSAPIRQQTFPCKVENGLVSVELPDPATGFA
jgi:nitrite reductase (NADH) small subunit